jgi:hypothetical protein
MHLPPVFAYCGRNLGRTEDDVADFGGQDKTPSNVYRNTITGKCLTFYLRESKGNAEKLE